MAGIGPLHIRSCYPDPRFLLLVRCLVGVPNDNMELAVLLLRTCIVVCRHMMGCNCDRIGVFLYPLIFFQGPFYFLFVIVS